MHSGLLRLLLEILIATIPFDIVTVDNVTCIEENHFYDDQGKFIFDQYIFWDERSRVIDWRLKKPNMKLRYNYEIGEYELRFIEGENHHRLVVSKCHSETWTQCDPELRDREFLEKEKRVLLTKPYYKRK